MKEVVTQFVYLQMSLEKSNPDEEGVKVGEDIPLDREDGGEVGEEQEGGSSGQEGGQEDQQAGKQ